MGTLVMAVGTLDGVVLAADSRYGTLGEGNPNIRQLGDRYAALLEPDVAAGTRILDATLENRPEAGFESLSTLAEQARQAALSLHEQADNGLQSTGLIFCGLDEAQDQPGFPQIFGIHAGRGFEVKGFYQNAFGGGLHAIARYLGDRLTRHRPTTQVGKYYALFALRASQQAFGPNLEPYACLATITAEDGFEWVDEQEVHEIAERVATTMSRLPSRLSSLFLEDPESTSTNIYKLERQ